MMDRITCNECIQLQRPVGIANALSDCDDEGKRTRWRVSRTEVKTLESWWRILVEEIAESGCDVVVIEGGSTGTAAAEVVHRVLRMLGAGCHDCSTEGVKVELVELGTAVDCVLAEAEEGASGGVW
jgi:hypothetical protein